MNISSLPKFKYIPSKSQHIQRNDFNKQPVGLLTYQGDKDEYNQRIFVDDAGNEWHELKWYNSIYHNPIKNIKLQYYHSDDHPQNVCSSEIIAPKQFVTSDVDGSVRVHAIFARNGSFNYRDFKKSNRFLHFLADVLPVAIYCVCIGA